MKIVLVKDVPNLGQAGDVKTVADGYARNYLLPRGLAILATEGALRQAKHQHTTEERRRKRTLENARDLAAVLSQLNLTFQAKVGETGRLYGSITSGDIASAIEEKLGKSIDRRKIALEEPIKMLGTHHVPVKLPSDVTAEVIVVVEKEGDEK